MKERPILFKGEMVRAILSGSKSQTRRAMKPQPPEFVRVRLGSNSLEHHFFDDGRDGEVARNWPDRNILSLCPHGQVGDRLWVKETTVNVEDHGYVGPVYAESDDGRSIIEYGLSPSPDDMTEVEPEDIKLRPSIFMSRAMSRITLEITGVRVERLQEISEADAKAEGCESLHEGEHGYVYREEHDWNICPKCGGTRLHDALGSNFGVIHDVDCRECDTYVKRYRHLWESINGKGSWNVNPWVWVIEFKRVGGAA